MIRLGSRVRHNNLICIVVGLSKVDAELQPVGSSARYSAPISALTEIMNEGDNGFSDCEPLYD